MASQWNYVEIPLRQHVGKPSLPIVTVGDVVLRGQHIASRDGLGANIHASVSGVVSRISPESIRITLSAEQPEGFVPIPETSSYLEAIEKAGVVGAGGAGFPAHVKFGVNLSGGSFIVNAAECEPSLKHNMQLLKEAPGLIVRALKYAMEITNASRGYIAIKPKNKAALLSIAKACRDEASIEIKYLPDAYPSGDERFILREILGHELGPGELPSAVEAVISNVETMKRVAEAIELRKPVISKDFTLNGRVVDIAKNGPKVFMEQPIGLPIMKYIEECGGYLAPYGELVLGGAFTGKRGDEEAVLTKTLGGVFVAMPFPNDSRSFGILACECGAQEARLAEIVEGMGGKVVAASYCKRMEPDSSGRLRCTKPGICPGQAEKIMEFVKKGAEAVIVGSCED